MEVFYFQNYGCNSQAVLQVRLLAQSGNKLKGLTMEQDASTADIECVPSPLHLHAYPQLIHSCKAPGAE